MKLPHIEQQTSLIRASTLKGVPAECGFMTESANYISVQQIFSLVGEAMSLITIKKYFYCNCQSTISWNRIQLEGPAGNIFPGAIRQPTVMISAKVGGCYTEGSGQARNIQRDTYNLNELCIDD
jgi:hypothetical protein